MRLPKLDPQKRYDGLYVVDFGDTAGVGYTAEEVAMLLESEQYRDVRVYKVHRMLPDGTVELKGVSSRRFQVESAFAFCSRDAARASKDFDDLAALAESDPLPCKARLVYGCLGYQPAFPWVTAILYPAEYEDELSAWLLKHDVRAGETVDAGISHATVVANNLQVRRHAQLASQAWRASRSREEVLRSVGRAVQR
jgi:hypothetical protein